MSKQMSEAQGTVRQMKKEIAGLQEQIVKNENAQKKAAQGLEAAKETEQKAIKTVLENSQAYQDAVKSIQTYKNRNEQITLSIKQHEAELSVLQQTYKSSKADYDNAKSTLADLKKQYGANSAEVKEQEKNVKILSGAYNSALAAYRQAKDTVQNLKAEYKSNSAAVDIQANAQKELKEQLINNSQAVKKAREQMKEYEQRMNDAKKTVQEARDKIRQLTPEVNKNKKAFDDAKKTVKEWGQGVMSSIDGAIKRIGQITMASASLVGGFAVKTGFETAFDLEAYRTQLETAVKDTEKASKLMKMAQDFSNASPFTSKETIQSTATMEAYGINSERWLSMVADMAGATNKEMEQATGALIDALSKQEFQGLEEFGISKEMVVERADTMYGKNKVFKKGGELKKGKDAEMQKVIEMLMSEKFGGGAEKLSKTVKGLWSTITGVTSDSLAQIFGMENGIIKSGSALDVLKQKLQIAADTLVKWQQDGTLDEMATKFTETLSLIIDNVVTFFKFIKENQTSIKVILGITASFYGLAKAIIFTHNAITTFKTIKTAATGILEFAKGFETAKNIIAGVKGTFIAVKAGILAFSPALLPVIAVIAAVAGVAYLLYKNFDTVVAVIKRCWESFKNFFNSMPEWAKMLLLPLTPIFWIVDALELLSKSIGKAWKWIKGFFGGGDEKKNIEISTSETLKKEIRPVNKMQKDMFKDSVFENTNTPQIKNNLSVSESKKEKIVVKEKQQINVTINGDVYGYNDFKEKIKRVMDEIIRFDLQNTV